MFVTRMQSILAFSWGMVVGAKIGTSSNATSEVRSTILWMFKLKDAIQNHTCKHSIDGYIVPDIIDQPPMINFQWLTTWLHLHGCAPPWLCHPGRVGAQTARLGQASKILTTISGHSLCPCVCQIACYPSVPWSLLQCTTYTKIGSGHSKWIVFFWTPEENPQTNGTVNPPFLVCMSIFQGVQQTSMVPIYIRLHPRSFIAHPWKLIIFERKVVFQNHHPSGVTCQCSVLYLSAHLSICLSLGEGPNSYCNLPSLKITVCP